MKLSLSQNKTILDPVAAYDLLAAHYSRFSKRRDTYLQSVEACIASRIPAGATSLLDIGAGDGSRALQIASVARISRVVLLEPSAQMARAVTGNVELWRFRAEELRVNQIAEQFDVVTCLWNVLGHIPGSGNRIRAMMNAAQLLSPQGRLFVDVIHRYNVRSCGLPLTAARWLWDCVAPAETNGDVVASWDTGAGTISTYGHVFTHREMRQLAQSAGLECVERLVLDYESGVTRRFACMGNLLYVFRRTSRTDSSKAPHTS